MTSKKRKKARAWMQAKEREVAGLRDDVKLANQRAEDANRARTIFADRLSRYQDRDGYTTEGFVRFPEDGSRECTVPITAPGGRYPFVGLRAMKYENVRFISVDHALEVRFDREEKSVVRWRTWEPVERGGKIEQTISHGAHHLRLALHEHMQTQTFRYGEPDSPLITAVRNALDELSLLNGNQIERMNHRVLEQRELTGMNRRRGWKLGDG